MKVKDILLSNYECSNWFHFEKIEFHDRKN